MSDITTTTPNTHAELISVLESSLYPGAKPESIELVLSYCRVNNLDPMLKPVHIVPQRVKVGPGKDDWRWRDVLMPGIADYRIKAARTGEYVGKTEPEFGPDITDVLDGVTITYPQWCKVTVNRWVQNSARSFVAKELWLENYATAKNDTDAPNRMWKKRPYGQLAKCAEAQALRMAFPEFSGGVPTAEEMEGKPGFGFEGQTIEAENPPPPPPSLEPPPPPPPSPEPKSPKPAGGGGNTAEVGPKFRTWFAKLQIDLAQAQSSAGIELIGERDEVKTVLSNANKSPVQTTRAEMVLDLFHAAYERVGHGKAADDGWSITDTPEPGNDQPAAGGGAA